MLIQSWGYCRGRLGLLNWLRLQEALSNVGAVTKASSSGAGPLALFILFLTKHTQPLTNDPYAGFGSNGPVARERGGTSLRKSVPQCGCTPGWLIVAQPQPRREGVSLLAVRLRPGAHLQLPVAGLAVWQSQWLTAR